jgi:putative solute:sodium symporter small subunit
MVIWLASIWFIAIFGFQILLKLIGKPTPEPAYLSFQKSWATVQSGAYESSDLIELGQSCLSVLGKIDLVPGAKAALENTLSWTLYQLYPEENRAELIKVIQDFEIQKAQITNLSDEDYIKAKNNLSEKYSPVLQLSKYDVRTKILPLVLSSAGTSRLSETTIEEMPGAMEKYLIHNQSFLTDFKFLGFPFHYFYTATFLLILFVGLCWIYCVKTDAMNKKLELSD